MADATVDAGRTATPTEPALVDPRAPRFGQALTAAGLAAGIALGAPVLVYAVAAVLLAAVLSGWRLDPYGLLWRTVARPLVGRPAEREAAAPHRFAKLMGATFTGLASGLLLAGLSTPGYAVAGMVAALAGVAAAFDLCVGCRLYRQVSLFRRLGVV